MNYQKSLVGLLGLTMAVVLTSLSSAVYANLLNGWKLEKEQKEVAVFTRKVDGYNLKEYKGTTTVKASVAAIVRIIKDVEIFTKLLK